MSLRHRTAIVSAAAVATLMALASADWAAAQGAQQNQGQQRRDQKEQPGFPQGGSVGMQSGNIQGRIMAKSDEALILRQPSGQELVILVNKDSVKDLQVGDEIEASVKAGGQAESFKKTRGAQPGGGIATSGTTGVPSMTDTPGEAGAK